MNWASRLIEIIIITQVFFGSAFDFGGVVSNNQVLAVENQNNSVELFTNQTSASLLPASEPSKSKLAETDENEESNNDSENKANRLEQSLESKVSKSTATQSSTSYEAVPTEESSSDIVTDETKNTAEKVQSRSAISTQATGGGLSAEDPRIVGNSEELRTAIEVDKVPFVKLASPQTPGEVFAMQNDSRISITADTTIDGNGRTVSYHNEKRQYAFDVGAFSGNAINIKFKNINFGTPDFSVFAYDYYGFCWTHSRKGVTIEVENFNYYSTAAAQAFHNAGSDSRIIFSGNNYFTLQKGSYSEEFAECNNFIFSENSHTIIDHNTGRSNSILTSGSNFIFDLKAGAKVDYTTTSNNFMSTPGGRAVFTLAEGAELNLTGNNNFVSGGQSYDVDIQKKAKLATSFANRYRFNNNSIINLASDSVLDMSASNSERVFENRIAPSNFIVDNAYRMSFNVATSSDREPINSGFTFNAFEGDVTGYGITTDNSPINTTIATEDALTSDGTNMTLTNAISSRDDFTTEEKADIRGANNLVFQRLPNPAVILKVKQAVRDTSASFNLADYLTNNNTLEKVVYQLYDSKQNTDHLGNALEEKEVASSITDKVTFDNLSEKNDYWLYVKIEAAFNTGSSTWFEVPFTTKSSDLSVSISTAMFFTTEMEEDQSLTVHSQSYGIKNNSAYLVETTLTSFEEDGDSGIELLDTAEPNNPKGLFLQLTKDREQLTTLKKDLTNVSIGELDTDEQANLRFAGEYFGSGGQVVNVNYKMTLKFEKVEE